MSSKVYFIKASTSDGEQVISERGRRLFKAGGFADDSFDREEILKISLKRANDIDKAHFKRKNIIFIGDRIEDFKSAQALGINFIGIYSNKKKYQRFLAEGATVIFPNYLDKEKIINALFLQASDD